MSVHEDAADTRATIIAGKLDIDAVRSQERRRTLQADPPFFRVGDPTVYDGEHLDIPAYIRKDVTLPGSLPRPVPAQITLFDERAPAGP